MADEPEERRAVRRQVDEAIVQAREAKALYQQAGSTAGVDQNVTTTLRNAAIRLHNVVYPYRDRDRVQKPWQEYNIGQFSESLNTPIEVETASNPTLSSRGETESRLAVARFGAHELAQVVDGLLECAIALGWAEKVSDKTILEKGTIEDVRWLVNTREQDKAIEALEPPEHRQPDEGDPVADGGVATAKASPVKPEITQPTSRVEGGKYPFLGPFFQIVADRKRQGKDAKIAVASANAETGVGKSTCAYYLAHVLDTTSAGYYPEDKATLSVGSFLKAYDELPKGSALILDEAEQLTGRRATSKDNVKASERWQMRRVAEICALLTLPKFSVLDPLMKDLVDFRVEVERRGLATIYKKSHRPFGDTWWQEIQQFEFPAMDHTAGMERLHQKKEEFNDGEEQNVVSEAEAKKKAESEAQQIAKQWRDETIRELAEQGLTYPEIRKHLETRVAKDIMDDDLLVTVERIGQIARGD